MARGSDRDRAISRAARSALNKTAKSARAGAIKFIRKTYAVKAASLRKAMTIKRATGKSSSAELVIGGSMMGLINFSARQGRKGVSVTVKRGSRKIIKHAFIAQVGRGHLGVFQRKTKKRLPIEEKFTVSPQGMFRGAGAENRVAAIVNRELPRIFKREIEFIFTKRLSKK